jgi:acyl-CoA dehydrogenase
MRCVEARETRKVDEYHDIMAQTARRLFTAHCNRSTLTRCAVGEWPDELWKAIEEIGFPRAAVSEGRAGLGLSIDAVLDLVLIAAEYSAPVPFGETIAAAWLLDRAGLTIPEGPLTFASDRLSALSASRSASGWQLEGKLDRVAYGRYATACVAAVSSAEGRLLFVLGPSDFAVEKGSNLAGEPRDRLVVCASISAKRVAPMPAEAGSLHALGAIVRTCQTAGAMARIGVQAVEYAQQRSQFGRPLSKFQAIQQSLAVLGTQVAMAGMAADMARRAIGKGFPFPTVAIAKARAAEAAGIGAAIAHQVHGAMGFTLEHSLHFSTKRLWSWRDEFGSEHEWNAAFGRHLLDAGADRLWPEITQV